MDNLLPNFYHIELEYLDQFKPDPTSLNQVYFPVCHHIVELDKIKDWTLNNQPNLLELTKMYLTLKGKDKEEVVNMLSKLDDNSLKSLMPMLQTYLETTGPMNLPSLVNFSVSNVMNVWWSLPEPVQEMVKKLVPDQDSWTLDCTKDKSGVWVFSLPQFLTVNESLCNGTEDVMDYWYTKLNSLNDKPSGPVTGSQMKVTVSKVPTDNYTTVLDWLYNDPTWVESNYYMDPGSNLKLWLCPYLQVLFKEVPKQLWMTLEVVG